MSAEEIQKLLHAGMQAARAGKKAEARQIMERVLEMDDNNEQAWLVMYSVVDTPRDRRICLENILEINPNNERAKELLAKLRPSPPSSDVSTPPAPQRTTTPRASPTPISPRSAGRVQAQVTAPAKRPGETSRATADAWVRQRSQRPINPAFVAIAVVAVVLLGLGLVLVSQGGESTGTPTAAQGVGAVPTLMPTGPTQTPPPLGTLVTFAPQQTVLPTWTPTISPTPPPSLTPTATLSPLSQYTLLFVGEGRDKPQPGLYVVRGDGTDERLILGGDVKVSDPAWSPDGKLIAYVTVVEGREQLAVANVDGSDQRVLTKFTWAARVMTPSWSPDSKQIVFAANETGSEELYLINADGTAETQLTQNTFPDIDPAFSPDGKQIVYAADPAKLKTLQIFVRDLTMDATVPGKALTASQGQNHSPVWSPDGKQIAFISTRNRQLDKVFLMRADGSDERILTFDDGDAENRDPAWSPDGSYVVFSSNRNGGVYNLFATTLNGRNIQQITNQPSSSYAPHFQPGS